MCHFLPFPRCRLNTTLFEFSLSYQTALSIKTEPSLKRHADVTLVSQTLNQFNPAGDCDEKNDLEVLASLV